MPTMQHTGPPRGPATAVPAIECIVPFSFDAADRSAGPEDVTYFQNHLESLYGPFDDLDWLTNGTLVSYHDMVRRVVRELGPLLTGVDLVITVDASPDCRHQSLPGCLLSDLIGGDPLMLGVSEQGIAGPFTALRIATDRMRAGLSRRALVLLMEQSTLPPEHGVVLPSRDTAVALLLAPDGALPLSRPIITVTGVVPDSPSPDALAGPAVPDPVADSPVALVFGAGLSDVAPDRDGATVIRADDGHPCAGVWLALARYLEQGAPSGGSVLVADRDPVLPYLCGVRLTVAAKPQSAVDVLAGLSPMRLREKELTS